PRAARRSPDTTPDDACNGDGRVSTGPTGRHGIRVGHVRGFGREAGTSGPKDRGGGPRGARAGPGEVRPNASPGQARARICSCRVGARAGPGEVRPTASPG